MAGDQAISHFISKECRIVLFRWDETAPSNSINSIHCQTCSKAFIGFRKLQTHIDRVHKKVKNFKCSFCQMKFYSYTELHRHIRSHTKEERTNCSICDLRATNYETIYSHEKTHFKSKLYSVSVTLKKYRESKRTLCPSFKCTFCSTKFENFQGISDHIKPFVKCLKCINCSNSFGSIDEKHAHELKTGDLECKFCYEKFTSFCDHHKHEVNHLGDFLKTKKCPQCPARLGTVSSLKLHIKTNHPTKDEVDTRCSSCALICESKAILKLHKILMHSGTNKFEMKEECYICREKTNAYGYAKHIIEKHFKKPVQGRIVCIYCHKVFSNFSNKNYVHITLRAHIRNHFNQASKKIEKTSDFQFKCKICDQTYPNYSALVVHKQKTHVKKQIHICMFCGKSMYSISVYKQHIQRHLKEKSYNCDQCGKKWVTLSDLKKHLKSHSTEKNYPCKFCGKSFGIVENQKRHENTVHSDKTVSCEICSKIFSHWNYLKDHMVIHNETKSFKCKFCDKTYQSRPNMYRHIREAHQSKSVK